MTSENWPLPGACVLFIRDHSIPMGCCICLQLEPLLPGVQSLGPHDHANLGWYYVSSVSAYNSTCLGSFMLLSLWCPPGGVAGVGAHLHFYRGTSSNNRQKGSQPMKGPDILRATALHLSNQSAGEWPFCPCCHIISVQVHDIPVCQRLLLCSPDAL